MYGEWFRDHAWQCTYTHYMTKMLCFIACVMQYNSCFMGNPKDISFFVFKTCFSVGVVGGILGGICGVFWGYLEDILGCF